MKTSKRLTLLVGLLACLLAGLAGLEQLIGPSPAAAAGWQQALAAALPPQTQEDIPPYIPDKEAYGLRPVVTPPPGPLCEILWQTPAYAAPDETSQSVTLNAGLRCYLLEAYVEAQWQQVQYQGEEYYLPAAAVDLSGCEAEYVFHREQDMRTRTCFTPEQLELCLSGPMSGLGQAFADAEAAYGVNALFMIAICQHESGNGESGLARNQNNLMGLRSGSGWASFESFAACVDYLGEYLSAYYLYPEAPWHHGSTISAVSRTYCNGSAAWINHIGNYMEKDLALICGE